MENGEVKDRILEVARELFIQNGYNGTSVRDIAKASDTNVAMVNYYYRSKYNLFEIIFDEAFNALMKNVFEIVNSDRPFFELIELWISTYYESLIKYPQIPIFILNEINHNSEELSKRVKSRDPYQIFSQISKRINEEVEKGTIRDTPALDFMLNILSLCVFPFVFGSLATKVTEKTPAEYHELLRLHKDYVVQFVINSIKI